MSKAPAAPNPKPADTPSAAEVAARCHEIQTGLGLNEVPEFDNLRAVGMGVRLALHIRGLPSVSIMAICADALQKEGKAPYETLKLAGIIRSAPDFLPERIAAGTGLVSIFLPNTESPSPSPASCAA